MRKLDVLDGEGQIVMHIYLDPKAAGLGQISTLSRSYCVFVYIFHVLIFSHFYITSQQSHFEDVNGSREL